MSGVLFSLEGVDGAGKTTQLARLSASLQERGHRVVSLREPGGTGLGERIRGLLLDRSDDPPVPVAELLLFTAARAQLMERAVRPALASGAVVLLDRFVDATFAYQASARGLPESDVVALEGIAAGLLPRRTWVLDLEPEASARRRAERGEAPDRMEAEGEAFRARVRAGYLERARRAPDRIAIVDADRSIEAIAAELLVDALRFLPA